MNFNEVIGKRISEFRRKNNLSQEDLAYRAGIDRSYMSSIERGKRSISLAITLKLCSALNISILELLTNEDGTHLNGKDIAGSD